MFRKKYFLKKFVRITTKSKMMARVGGDKEQPMNAMVPMVMQGYVVDEDKDTYFLGEEVNKVTFAILKSETFLVELHTPPAPEVEYTEAGKAKDDFDVSPEKGFFYGGSNNKLPS